MQFYECRPIVVLRTCAGTSQVEREIRNSVWAASGTISGVDEDFSIGTALEAWLRIIAERLHAENNSGRGVRRSCREIAGHTGVLDPIAICRLARSNQRTGVLAFERFNQTDDIKSVTEACTGIH